MGKHQDLQPWFDYFELLQTYVEKGYLEVLAEKNEAYITRPAFFALCGYDDVRQLEDTSPVAVSRRIKSVTDTMACIRTYTGWKSQQGVSFIEKPFAIHVVKEDLPHDLLYTLLLTRKRVWWNFWKKTDCAEVFSYGKPET